MLMTFRQFAFNNVVRNIRTYAAFFLSSAFAVMVFFVYAVFAFHPSLSSQNVGTNATFVLHLAEGIIFVFSFFFVLYSLSTFLKSRKKEFGLLLLCGITDYQMKRMVFLENLIIGFFATLSGITGGLIMAKGILLVAGSVLELDRNLPFYWPVEAVLLTLFSFMVLFISVSFFTLRILRSSTLINLIKSCTSSRPEPKANVLLALLASVLLGGGYAGLLAVSDTTVLKVLLPVTLLLIAGTYLLFSQLSVYLINRGRKRKSFFWRRTNLLFLSDLGYRMKDNARLFFLVSILCTVAFTAIGTLVSLQTVLLGLVSDRSNFPFEYRSYKPTQHESDYLAYIDRELQQSGVEYRRLGMTLKGQKSTGGELHVLVKASEFNAIAKVKGEEEVHPARNEAVGVLFDFDISNRSKPGPEELALEGQPAVLKVDRWVSSKAQLNRKTYVVEDAMFGQLANPAAITQFYGYETGFSGDARRIGEAVSDYFKQSPDAKSIKFFSKAYELHLLKQELGSVLFIGLFIGLVFFIAAGSFLYFRLYADLENDKRKYAAIMKLGLTDAELSRIISRQMRVLFFVPVAVALIHGAVALKALEHMFRYPLGKEALLVLGTFLLVQTAYYLLLRFSYVKRVKLG
jgi:putative ABC transport system permease protein